MKALMISLPPKTCEQIFSGKQTMVLMKKLPKLTPPYRVYVYCTKESLTNYSYLHRNSGHGLQFGDFATWSEIGDVKVNVSTPYFYMSYGCSGKVIGSFVCDDNVIVSETEHTHRLYALHITEAQLFDEPKEIGSFITKKSREADCDLCANAPKGKPAQEVEWCIRYCIQCGRARGGLFRQKLTRPPATFVYVEEV